MTTINRRRLAGISLSTAAAVAATRTFAQAPATPAATPTGEWTYTDLDGTTVTLTEVPTRIAANIVTAAALWDLGIKVVAVFDWTASAYPDGDHIAWGNIDVSQIQIVSNVDGNIEPEFLIAADVDVVFTQAFESQLNGIPDDQLDVFNEIAPVLVITDQEPADIQVDRVVALAESLGADLDAPEIVAMKDAYDAKIEEFRTLAAEKSDLLTLFINADAADLYVGGPEGVADLRFLQGLGLQFANADSAAAGDFWESLSAEQALLYPADVLYMDVYSMLKTAEELMAEPAYSAMPAAQAGQVGTWIRDYPASYEGVTGFLELILEPLRSAVRVIS